MVGSSNLKAQYIAKLNMLIIPSVILIMFKIREVLTFQKIDQNKVIKESANIPLNMLILFMITFKRNK